jgi:hypothetical protein
MANDHLSLPKTSSGMTMGWAYGNEAADGFFLQSMPEHFDQQIAANPAWSLGSNKARQVWSISSGPRFPRSSTFAERCAY